MKTKLSPWSRRYQVALRAHLKPGGPASLASARGLGGEALKNGLQTLDLAKLHERTLVVELLPGCPVKKRAALIKQAGRFFAAAIAPLENARPSARQVDRQLRHFIAALSQRTVELAASNRELSLEIAQRKAVEAALKKSERHYAQLLEQSGCMQAQLRQLSRQVLSAQEEERKNISRELHDVIAQTLTGINIRLAALKKEAAVSTQNLEHNITLTQQLVENSVSLVHQFARELRPAVLDDLGLIPALLTFMKGFTARTGVRASLTAFATVERLDTAKRTVLFRVAQEALTNVGRHAQASQVQVSIARQPGRVCMRISDDGKAFNAPRVLLARGGKRLGLLGMRERLEMIGGRFDVASAPGKGTAITAWIPFANGRLAEGKIVSDRL